MIETKYSTSYNKVFNATLKVLDELEFEIVEENKKEEYIIARNHVSFWSYGERIEITFEPKGTSTEVVIHSFSKGIQLIDLAGTNDKNEESILKKLNTKLK